MATTAAPKPLKKGTTVQFSTGSRVGTKSYTGTVYAFVPAGETPKAPKSMGDVKASNRDRYIVKVGEDLRFANAKSTLAAASA